MNTLRITAALCVSFVPVLFAAAPTPPTSISDADVLKYASAPYDKAAVYNKRTVLGRLNGVEVVVEHPCSDICPDYTVRVIRLEVPPGATCASLGGIEKSLLIPMSIAMVPKVFCFPRVLVDHWNAYIR